MSPTRGTLKLVWILAAVALVALLGFGLSRGPEGTIDSELQQGRRPQAPALLLPGLIGGSASLQDWRGEVVVLNFWASWCDPCREESTLLQRTHDRIRARGGTVVGVDALDISSDARAFARDNELTYPMLRDADGDSLDAFGVHGFPETFVLDRRGRVTAVRHGVVDEPWLRQELDAMLEERG